jgi:hypothetical protein
MDMIIFDQQRLRLKMGSVFLMPPGSLAILAEFYVVIGDDQAGKDPFSAGTHGMRWSWQSQ